MTEKLKIKIKDFQGSVTQIKYCPVAIPNTEQRTPCVVYVTD